jgi:6-pyruvoyltetrahydropterin/6-carboxytetrahydropterin synthase
MKVTFRYPFSAAHRLHSDQLSEDDNWRVYGRCNNPFGHGHNYTLEVTVQGEPDEESGLVVDRKQLDSLVQQEILSRVEHTNLNIQVAELRDLVPTTENVAYVFAEWLRRGWSRHFSQQDVTFNRIRIYETRNNRFEIEAHEVKQ